MQQLGNLALQSTKRPQAGAVRLASLLCVMDVNVIIGPVVLAVVVNVRGAVDLLIYLASYRILPIGHPLWHMRCTMVQLLYC